MPELGTIIGLISGKTKALSSAITNLLVPGGETVTLTNGESFFLRNYQYMV